MHELPDPPVPLDELRAASTSALFAPLAARVAGAVRALEAAVKAQIAEEEAELKLRLVVNVANVDGLMAEAERRADVIAEMWAASPDGPPPGVSPKSAGLDSVIRDAWAGVL